LLSLHERAFGGDRRAQMQLDIWRRAGRGSHADYINPFRLKAGAAAGNVEMQARLGIAYLEGQGGLEKDPVEARRLLEEVVETAQHSQAQYLLGEIYLQGLGVEPDEARALQHFRSSHRQGFVRAGARLHQVRPDAETLRMAEEARSRGDRLAKELLEGKADPESRR
ncbi:MAG: sel1 repeat family protein, partial [Opitutales bacterium]|nr:sel1 repeat family protein [Opitutales bacterium]